jgi:hypothetical protein
MSVDFVRAVREACLQAVRGFSSSQKNRFFSRKQF